jgi:hypothetical protein
VFVVGDFLHLQWDVVVATLSTLSRSVNSCLLSLSLGLSSLKDSGFDPYEEEQKRKNNSPNELHRSSNLTCTQTKLPTNHESPVTSAMGHYAVPTPHFHAGLICIS